MKTIIKSLFSNKTVTTSWQDLTKLPSLDWGQDTTDSTNIWTDVLLWRGRTRYLPHFRHAKTIRHWEKQYDHYQQHSRRSFMDPWMPYRRPPDL
jgi:hypothetical protein